MAAAMDTQQAWGENIIADDEWEIYRAVIRGARARSIQFALGGAFGYATYTNQWRNTKDLDLYVLPEDRNALIEVLSGAGLQDLHPTLPYDRAWIYRGHREDVIVDVIWAMANQRAQVDAQWFSRARWVELRGERAQVIPPEEMLWQKLYIIQRERCDWPDVLNLVDAVSPYMDWAHLFDRLGPDWPLLRGMLSVYGWLCPGKVQNIPQWVWDRVEPTPPGDAGAPDIDRARVALLDSRPWFQVR